MILFHLGFAWLPGGFLGVDVFFVISGYLIGSLISRDLAAGTFTFGNFWARRVRRIMPALLTMVLLTLVASSVLVTSGQLASIGWDALAASFSYANIWMFSKFGNYWGPAAETSPFLHAWSLSVEEQFYLVFPLFLVALARWKIANTRALAIVALLSFGAFLIVSAKNPTLSFYILPTRAWELLLGALTAASAAHVADRVPLRWQGLASAAGLGLIVASLFLVDGKTGLGASTALPALGAALVLLYSDGGNRANALLSSKPFVFIGRISYSLYLWHWAIIIIAGMVQLRTAKPVPLVWVVGLTAASSLLSHYLVEKPARASAKGVWVAAALLLVVTGVSAASIRRASHSEVTGDYSTVLYYSAYYDATPIQETPVQVADTNPNDPSLGNWAGVTGKVPNPQWADAYKHGGIPGGTRAYGERADLLLIGDSHGCMWGKTVDEVSTELGLAAAFFTFDGNVPFFPIPVQPGAAHGTGFTDEMFLEFSNELLKDIDRWKPRVVIFASRWESKNAQDFRNVEMLVDYASKAGARLLFINNPPRLPWENVSAVSSLALLGVKPLDPQPRYVEAPKVRKLDAANRRLRQLVGRTPGARLLDVYSALRKGEQVEVLNGRDVLYFDDDHLSYRGTSLFKAALAGEISSLLKQ